MNSPVTDTTVTPRTFSFTPDQLNLMQSHTDKSVQTIIDYSSRKVTIGPKMTIETFTSDGITKTSHLEKTHT